MAQVARAVKISVIITTHNRAALLREAIESVLHQEPCGAEVEVIVVDDDSTDDTVAVVAAYPGVRYVHTKQGTAAGSRNVGISQAQGEWLAFLDDDDVWLPTKLRTCCGVIRERPQAQYIFSAATICDHQLHPKSLWLGPPSTDRRSLYSAFLEHVVCPSVVMMRKDIFAQIGLFDASVPRAEDRDMWLRIIAHGFESASTTESLILYRVREKINGDMLYKTYIETMKVLRRHFATDGAIRPSWRRQQRILWRTRGWYARELMMAARHEENEGQRGHAVRFRRAAFGISPVHAMKLWAARS